MYIVTTVKIYDNHTVDVQTVETAEQARTLRQGKVDTLLRDFPEVDFNVAGNEHSPYLTVRQDHGDKAVWLVAKITHHSA